MMKCMIHAWENLKRFPYKGYSQYMAFMCFHCYRMFLKWLQKAIVDPLEAYLDKYAKHEPEETQWVNIHSLTVSNCITQLDLEKPFFGSEEMYHFSYIRNFDTFLLNEYETFVGTSMKPPAYDAELEQTPEVVERLFMARNGPQYIIRTFPAYKTVQNKSALVPAESANIEFIIVEYTHPGLYDGIPLHIPDGYYTVGNELFSAACVQRMLELQRGYYEFDTSYTLVFVDHNLEKQTLKWDEYIRIEKSGYTKHTIHDTASCVIKEKECNSIQSDDDSGSLWSYFTFASTNT